MATKVLFKPGSYRQQEQQATEFLIEKEFSNLLYFAKR